MIRDGIDLDGELYGLDGQPPAAEAGGRQRAYADIAPPTAPPPQPNA